MSLYAVLTRPLRNLRELWLGTPRADKALSDPIETNGHVRSGHVKGPRDLSSENDSPMKRLGEILFDIVENSMSLWFYTKID
uniref:Uncharacterized protein n=1 Tax=Oryza sativa subsp. japonica TaxID=39947 RepID=Q6EUJ8_ORYSJ|nr:hypothetical protein [Oryza sativa Japonica Group]